MIVADAQMSEKMTRPVEYAVGWRGNSSLYQLSLNVIAPWNWWIAFTHISLPGK